MISSMILATGRYVTILLCSALFAAASAEAADWAKIREAYDRYLEHPTEKSAEVLVSIIPGYHAQSSREEESARNETLEHVFEWQRFSVVEQHVTAGDETAMRVMFALQRIADGDAGEAISIALGSTIIDHPGLFLRVLQDNMDYSRLDALLGNLGPDFVDRFDAQADELQKRYDAIYAVSVDDSELAAVKRACLAELRKAISEARN